VYFCFIAQLGYFSICSSNALFFASSALPQIRANVISLTTCITCFIKFDAILFVFGGGGGCCLKMTLALKSTVT
jgi:hypothetical protein